VAASRSVDDRDRRRAPRVIGPAAHEAKIITLGAD
jgi:hypothetical protein